MADTPSTTTAGVYSGRMGAQHLRGSIGAEYAGFYEVCHARLLLPL